MAKKKNTRSVVQRKLIGFDQSMLDGLEKKLSEGFAKNQTAVLRRLLVGEHRFSSDIEAFISAYMKSAHVSRDYAIQRLLLDAVERRDPKFRLPEGN